MPRYSSPGTCPPGSSSASSTSSSSSTDADSRFVPLSAVYERLRRLGERLHRQGGGSKKKGAGLGLWLTSKSFPVSSICPAGVVVLVYFKGKQWSSTGVHVSHSFCSHVDQSMRGSAQRPINPMEEPEPRDVAAERGSACKSPVAASSPLASRDLPLPSSETVAVPSPCSSRSPRPVLVVTVEEALFFLAGKNPHATGSSLVIFDSQTARQVHALDLLLALLKGRLPAATPRPSTAVQRFRERNARAGNEQSGCSCDRLAHLENATEDSVSPRRLPKLRGAQDESTQQNVGMMVERTLLGEGRLTGEPCITRREDRVRSTYREEVGTPPPPGFADQPHFTYQELQVYLQLKGLGLPIRNRHSSELAAAVRLCPIVVSSRFLSPSFPELCSPVDEISNFPTMSTLRSHSSSSGTEAGNSGQGEEERIHRTPGLAVHPEASPRSPWVILLERRHKRRTEFDEYPSPAGARAGSSPSRLPGLCLAMEEEDFSLSEVSVASDTGNDSCSHTLTDSDCGSEGEGVAPDLEELSISLAGPNKPNARHKSAGKSTPRQDGEDTMPATNRLPVLPVSPEATAAHVLLPHFGVLRASGVTVGSALSVTRSQRDTREQKCDSGRDYGASFTAPSSGGRFEEKSPSKRNKHSQIKNSRRSKIPKKCQPEVAQFREWRGIEHREVDSSAGGSGKEDEDDSELPDGGPHRKKKLCKIESKTNIGALVQETLQKDVPSLPLLVAPTSLDGGVTFLTAQQVMVL
uniref:Uncharacterized protein n=1 Tax=Toxoplasma gondii COUG TaxID=1074873 RepID=A0A2G8XR25_TOXGO|nr:hypothetical protein TGCOUG_306250 [Toxoplasma gondii COUG]